MGIALKHSNRGGEEMGETKADIKSYWSSGNLFFVEKTAGSGAVLNFGKSAQGLDVKFWGSAATNFMLWDESVNALVFDGDARIDLTACDVAAANTDGGVIKCGTSAAPVTEDTANMKFMAFYFDNGKTSGDNRGMYLRLYLTGADGGGESARLFTSVTNVAAGTAHGAHISLSFGDTGTVTGLGVAMRATLHIANQATQAGTMAAVQAEIWSDGATSDPAGSLLSCFRVVNGGNATGMADVDDDAYLFEFAGWTVGAGNMIQTDTGNVDTLLKCRLPDGSALYIMCTKTIT